MIILIDGYNLLHRIMAEIYDLEDQRMWLINMLTTYARKKKNNILVVFDGGPFYWPSEQEKNKYITIVFSGQKMNADEYLKEYILENKINEILLVTDDRQIADVAYEYSKPSIGSKHFYNLVQDALSVQALKKPEKPQISKLPGRPEHEMLDALMHEAAKIQSPEKSENTHLLAQKRKQKLSRHEKKMMKLLKKL